MGSLWIALKSWILWVGFAAALFFSAIFAILSSIASTPFVEGDAWRITIPQAFAVPLASAAVTIFATGFLGGILKVILDVINVEREGRSDRFRFLQNTLDDVKAIEDRLQRTRVVILAHRSVKTYGDEMRDIIDARVKVKNIERAYRLTALDFPGPFRGKIQASAKEIIDACNALIEEFQEKYKPLADCQRVHEALLDQALKNTSDVKEGIAKAEERDSEIWKRLKELPTLQEFLPPNSQSYEERFGRHVDDLTRMLRDAMQATREGRRPT